jgi:hypothetical protein
VSDEKDKPLGTRLLKWASGWLAGGPHFKIGGEDDPYLLRWYLLPRNRLFNVYLHKFLRDDIDTALHDHPWWFVSWIVKGGYYEVTQDPTVPRAEVVRTRAAGSVAFRRADHRHRVVLLRSRQDYRMLPCWTVVVTGPVSRSWGFWCNGRFIHWRKFTEDYEGGSRVGGGCGESTRK